MAAFVIYVIKWAVALTLLYEDEDTCAEAGLDWSLLPEPEPAKQTTDFSKYHFNH